MFVKFIGRLAVIAAVTCLGTAQGDAQRNDDLVVASSKNTTRYIPVDGGTGSDANCDFEGPTSWRPSTKFVVIRRQFCSTRIVSKRDLYEVAVEGKVYVVSKYSFDLTESDLKKLHAYELNPAIRDQAIAASERIALEIAESSRKAEEAAAAQRKARTDAYRKELLTKENFGVAIASANIQENAYVDATSFDVTVVNPTKKAIKYVTFTVTGYNAVGDPVLERLKGKSKLQVQGIGPIESFASGSYKWEFMWHTKIVESFKLNEIKIEYMDKSVKVVKEKDWRALVLNSEIVAAVKED